ncbi:AMP-binding protein, partial [Pseudosporangium ferrugineum]|uniref:AMP-binding protein n=1 Tax=Pseudosporangium ferrugineum TaxID=439699 RepID=UPI0011B235D7
RPQATAVVFEDQQLSYAQLNEQANQLAWALITHGVGPEGRVLLCMDRSAEYVVACLAVLKAGGVYVPVDVDEPALRLREMVDDLAPVAAITDREVPESIADRCPAVLTVSDGIGQENVSGPARSIGSDALAYVMFTSGSSGRPKGIAVTHGNVCSFARDSCWRGETSIVALFHSRQSFDASTFELWAPLANGGTVVVAGERPLDAATVRRYVSEYTLTHLWLTTAVFNAVVDADPTCFTNLQQVWTGGEAVSAERINATLNASPDLSVFNGYGPTETTTFATFANAREAVRNSSPVPIGCPMDNTRVYVLDSGLLPVPPGVSGELYVAGLGVARGYLNRP